MKERFFLLAALLIPGLELTAESRIVVKDEAIRPVERRIFGTNQIAGVNRKNQKTGGRNRTYDLGMGIWDPAGNAPNPEMVRLAREAGVTVHRWPGGCRTHNFDWKKLIGKAESRPNNRFGLPEFLRFCRETKAIPIITLPDYSGTAQDAADLVEYLNSPDDGNHPWAARRAGDGHPEPYGVVYFEYGNETYHGNHEGSLSQGAKGIIYAPEYARRYAEYRRAMRKVDPRIRLGAVCHEEWIPEILKRNGKNVDFFVPHIYIGTYSANDGAIAPETLFSIALGGVRICTRKLASVQKEAETLGIQKNFPLAVTEYNCFMHNNKPRPYRFSLGGALISAEILRILLHDPNVFMANYWLFANEFWGTIRNFQAPHLRRPAHYMFTLFRRHLQEELLRTEVQCPRFDSPGGYGVPRASGAVSAEGEAKESARNLLPPQPWKFIGGAKEKEIFSQKELADGTLEITFHKDIFLNYFHAQKRMPANSLSGYRVSAEIRTEGMEDSSGAAIQIGDGRGFDATRSCAVSPGVLSRQWRTISTVYTPLADTKSLLISMRRLAGNSRGKILVRNVRVTETIPDNIGASPLVEVTASRSKDGKKYSFVIINKSMKEPEPLFLALPGIRRVTAETLSGPSVDAVNEDDPECVTLRPQKCRIAEEGLRTLLPPHSLTGITVER